MIFKDHNVLMNMQPRQASLFWVRETQIGYIQFSYIYWNQPIMFVETAFDSSSMGGPIRIGAVL